MRDLGKKLFTVAISLALAALGMGTMHADAQSSMSEYGKLKNYCGTDVIPRDGTTIPSMGCFILSANRSASGTFSNHHVEVAVDASGEELFIVDGTVIERVILPPPTARGMTNVSYVRATGGAGYKLCDGVSTEACPVDISADTRYPDRSVLFMVFQCPPPTYRFCANTQENLGWINSGMP